MGKIIFTPKKKGTIIFTPKKKPVIEITPKARVPFKRAKYVALKKNKDTLI